MIQIQIGNKTINLGRGAQPLSLVYSIADNDDPSKLVGFRSKQSMAFPVNKETAEIFEGYEDTARISENANTLRRHVIKSNGLPVMNGSFQLFETATKGGTYTKDGDEYKAIFYGNNSNWFGLISEVEVGGLDWPTFTLNNSNILDIGNNSVADGDDFTVTLFKWKDWVDPTKVSLEEHSVGLFLKSILTKAFNSIGYKLESDFFDTEEFESLGLPMPMRYPPGTEPLTESTVFGSVNTANSPNVDFTSTYNDPDSNINLTANTYAVDVSGVMGVVIGGFSIAVNYSVYINGSVASVLYSDATNDYYQVAANDIVTVRGFFNGSFPLTVGTGSPIITFKLIPYVGVGFTQFVQKMIPSGWSISDILIDITLIFGLKWDTNEGERLIRVEPTDGYVSRWNGIDTKKDGYHKKSFKSYDQSIDLSKRGQLSPNHNAARETHFQWAEDDDTAKAVSEGLMVKVYDAKYKRGEVFSNSTKSHKTKFFAKTISQTDANVTSGGTSTARFPFAFPKNYLEDPSATDETDYDFQPRLLYFGGRRGGIDGTVRMDGVSNYDWPVSWFVSGRVGDPSLAFGGNFSSTGLLQRFHLHSLVRIERGRKIKESFFIDEVDILNFSFRDIKLYQGRDCITTKINGYKPGTEGSTPHELQQDERPTSEDVLKIEASFLSGNISTF